ncbi:MAG TPA: TonB-dependent receptor, partial [Opitutus sp.]|nr:TonB-dependent receptor [Opitutus sp.]
FETDGFHTVAPERRGPIDTRAGARARWGAARWRQAWGDDLAATLTVRRFAEDRRNGTPYQQNRTDETFASLAVAARASASFQWNATAYAQSQDFSSTFSSVNAARTAETPASNQFSVPATATGLAWVGEWTPTADALTTFGADVRDTRGETREDSAFVSNAFTRRRFAGGRQTTAGAFLLHSRALLRDARLAVGLRADRWAETDGHRRDSLNGAQVADERFRDRDGVELSPSLGLVVPLRPGLRLHASGQHAFRRPTLNELYRPFRVGNVITDANPALRTERITSGELALRGESGPFRAGAAAFVNELRDAVGNVTVAQGPGNFPGIGFVPPGGEGRRRLNLDRVRVQGVSFEASWQLAPALSADAHSLWNDARVRRATVAPALRGLRLAQVPRHSAALGFTWKHDRWSFAPRARYLGRQFEDDLNQLRLGAAVVVDASLRYALDAHTEFFASAENLLDDRVETGRSAEGLVNLGTPRLILVGVRLQR